MVRIGRQRLELVAWGRFALDVEVAVYGTVVLLTVLAVAEDDGVEDFVTAAQVVVGPLVATFAAHLFASVLAAVNEDRALPSGRRFRSLTAHAAQYLLLAVPPLIVVGVYALAGIGGREGPTEALDLVGDLGLLLLVVLGGVGGWRALRRWWAALLGASVAFVIGLIVIILRILIEH
ncbi:hypothetical protein [Actinomycetospora termitidis]|uniref:Integral membrane protein n=1 Tax=Actinomycetospora termitidis TaxID=3053470 RepID=A0ABT7M9B4_9PSEU|nr:hypothetical protein [Actinomycetospora sp. Odt1-22]MDL5157270.1 hypothetical protein [Actinomycetospora sp. Odt1-22]